MKTKLCFFIAIGFLSTNLFSQTKAIKPLTAKTVAPTPAINTMKLKTPTDLQKGDVNVEFGVGGINANTKLTIIVWDQAHHMIAYYAKNDGALNGLSPGQFSQGQNATLPLTLFAGEISNLPRGALSRNAQFADFSFEGGSMDLMIETAGTILKITRLTLDLYFNGDGGTPRSVIWTNLTISDHLAPNLKFDKNFNPVQ